jgi:hypothetical protein
MTREVLPNEIYNGPHYALRQQLELIVMGLTNKRNACWPTARPWTKKERDEAILDAAREGLELLAVIRGSEWT